MSKFAERFLVGTKAAIEGYKEFVKTRDVIKATYKVKETLEDYLENEKNLISNKTGK